MALKSTIYKASLQVADMDRGVYATHALTLALHPSETEERLMARLLAFGLHADASEGADTLQFARGLSDADEPDLWQRDLTGQLLHWIEVGHPDERRLSRACGRAERVTILAYAAATPVWWQGLQRQVARLAPLAVWQLPAAQSQALAGLAQRSLQLQLTVQDGLAWMADGTQSVELQLECLKPGRA